VLRARRAENGANTDGTGLYCKTTSFSISARYSASIMVTFIRPWR